jgi:hypothetical protein
MRLQTTSILLCTLLVLLAACSRKTAAVPAAPTPTPPDNSYLDLRSGSTLKIVLPLLKSGGFRPTLHAQETTGNTISVAAADLVGYMTLKYAVAGRHGLVRLKWTAAQETERGQTLPVAEPPALPFQLPRKPEHVRLIYLVRVSEADHNMAIVGSKRLDSLNAFTARLERDPGLCRPDEEIFCSWVPSGIAVRPEQQ